MVEVEADENAKKIQQSTFQKEEEEEEISPSFYPHRFHWGTDQLVPT